MKKKILSIFTALAMLLGSAAAVTAENETESASVSPTVYVDDELIMFKDQPAVIMNDFTMVPVRGVFNAMGAKVSWDSTAQMVTIDSRNNMIRIKLTVGSNIMTVYNFIDLLSAEEKQIELEAPPVIVNDNETYRTLIPLRAISEGLGSDVVWDKDAFAVYITSPETEKIENKAELSLSANKAQVNADEELEVFVDLKNIASYPDDAVGGSTVSIKYDKENFELIESGLCSNEGELLEDNTGITNDKYTEDSLKSVFVTIDAENMVRNDGHILKLVFKAKNSNPSSFSLVNRYNTQIGHDTTVLFTDPETTASYELGGKRLVVDTTPLIINAAAE